jgi:RimJ/RimL family protein N-acetyltransferase
MPIPGIEQPEIFPIGADLRLRRFDGDCGAALLWYQDEETQVLIDGKAKPYTPARIKRMYDYLSERGELYWIKSRESDRWIPIGDVTFWQEDMPLVIGPREYRGRGIGRRVIKALCSRARDLGWQEAFVDEIYDFNEGSRRCVESVGFTPYEKTEKGSRYVLKLEEWE